MIPDWMRVAGVILAALVSVGVTYVACLWLGLKFAEWDARKGGRRDV